MPSHARPARLRSSCPIAAALDLLGDRWTLLVLRDVLVFKKALFGEFLASPEKLSSNTLAERLKRLERAGLLRQEVYQRRPKRCRYIATAKGRDLLPLLVEALKWGTRHVAGTAPFTAAQLRQLRARAARG
ncbi:MAG: helix-turn-helix transcriptional regulator [Planctomycetes bacterium]|nr:helix-turn-helix transcriptional regulator [Planctomycetota bacterium]